jgi:hypothetical protein
MVDKVALEPGLALSFFGFTLLIIIPPLLHTHSSPLPEVCHIPDKAAHYQFSVFNFGVYVVSEP